MTCFMPAYYDGETVRRSYAWLGHRDGMTELNAFHPDYRPGKEHREWNRYHGTYPRIAYARNIDDVLAFLERYAGGRTCCYSINPRPDALRNQHGYLRSATEQDIQVSQTLLLDLDFRERPPTPTQGCALIAFLDRVEEYFQDHGFQAPARSCTGGGAHLLCAYTPINVADYPDIAHRLSGFRESFEKDFRHELTSLDVRVDPTQDLRRVTRIYGTSKRGLGIQSTFAGQRHEDERLREYLLTHNPPAVSETNEALPTAIATGLPAWFATRLQDDQELAHLWVGQGKPEGTDQSRSGFDYSIIRYLHQRGHNDPSELAAILLHRPGGAAKNKGEAYIARTIGNARKGRQ